MSERIIGYADVGKGPDEALLITTEERFIVGWTWRHGLLVRSLAPWFLRTILRVQKARKLEKLSADEILTADDHNFAIPFSDVVRIKLGGLLQKNIVIATRETGYRFRFRRKPECYHFEDHALPYLTDELSIRCN